MRSIKQLTMKVYARVVDESFVVTMAAFAPGAKDKARSSVILKVLLATLRSP
jgi:hypothetical protein